MSRTSLSVFRCVTAKGQACIPRGPFACARALAGPGRAVAGPSRTMADHTLRVASRFTARVSHFSLSLPLLSIFIPHFLLIAMSRRRFSPATLDHDVDGVTWTSLSRDAIGGRNGPRHPATPSRRAGPGPAPYRIGGKVQETTSSRQRAHVCVCVCVCARVCLCVRVWQLGGLGMGQRRGMLAGGGRSQRGVSWDGVRT